MGVLTDFVIANRDDADRVGNSLCPSKDFNGIDAKGMDQVKMGTLYSIISKKEYDPDFLVDENSFVFAGSDDGPWVQIIPDDMTNQLSQIESSDLDSILNEWMQTEEFEPDYTAWTREDAESFVKELIELAKQASAEGKAIFMWTSL